MSFVIKGAKRYKTSDVVQHLCDDQIPSGSECSSDNFESDDNDLDPDWETEKNDEFGSDQSETDADSDNGKNESDENVVVKRKKVAVQKPQWFGCRDNSFHREPPKFRGHDDNIENPREKSIDVFLRLFPETLINTIVFESNFYANQNGKNLILSTGELKVFIGINLIMTYVRYSRIRLYWSSDSALRLPIIADSMSINRFEDIRRYIHFTDVEADENDRFFELRPVLDVFSTTFPAEKCYEENLSIDEMMIPFKGRSKMKQYIKSKPKPWGFKVWVLSGISGYVYKFEMYEGKKSAEISDLGKHGDVVYRLCEGLEDVNHKVYFDNLFNSYNLLAALQKKGIYALGTIRKNRLLGCNEALKSEKELKSEGRGAMSVATSSDNVSIVRWYDNNIVHVASTFCGKDPVDKVSRWSASQKKVIEVDRPASVTIYNKHMGGVDLMDQLVATYRHSFKQKRWYQRIFWHFVNICIANGWIIYRQLDKSCDLLCYKSSVARSLINQGLQITNQRKPGRPSLSPIEILKKKKPQHSCPDEIRFEKHSGHLPKKTDDKNARRCHFSGCKSKTRFLCTKCNEPVCPDCMANFHSQK